MMKHSQDQHLAAFETMCRNAGLRLTPQRIEVFSELLTATDHPSAEAVHQRLRGRFPTISLDTVYRTLSTLASYGLIHKVETVESQARYEVVLTRHHHLICSRCKEIMDFNWDAFDSAALPEELQEWGRIDNTNVVVYGICRRCLKP